MTGLIYVDAAQYHVSERDLFATVTLARSGDLSGPVSVTFTTTSGTAVAGSDFGAGTGTAIFGKGVPRTNVTVPILDDRLPEPAEDFVFSIVAVDPTSTIGAPRTSTISIDDDDGPAVAGTEPLKPAYRVSVTPLGQPNLRLPLAMAFLNGTSRAFVAEKGGLIKLLDVASNEKPAQLLDLRSQVNSREARGLLDIAFHPDLEHFPYLYAYFVVDPPGTATATGGASPDAGGNRFVHLSRFTLDLSHPMPAVVKGSEVVLLGGGGQSLADIAGGGALDYSDVAFADRAGSSRAAAGGFKRDYVKVDSSTHAGGGLAFGTDGMLYVGTGDGSAFDFADSRAVDAQDPDSLSGKILRIDPVSGRGLADNPFSDGDLDSNRSRVWALGLRNPYTITFAPDGRLFISDTGWDSWEEINIGAPGANYGWPFYEGGDHGTLLQTTAYDRMPAARALYDAVAAGTATVTPAFRAFSHLATDPGFQISGIVGASSIYTGDKYPPALQHAYFFTDVADGEIYAVDADDPGRLQYVTDLGGFGPTEMVQGPDGYMYLTDMVNDRILRLKIETE